MEDSDIDELRRSDSVKKIGDFNAGFNSPTPLKDIQLQNQENKRHNYNRKMLLDIPTTLGLIIFYIYTK